MVELDELEGIDVIPPKQGMLISLKVSPEEIELALATNGNSLRRALVVALLAAMAVDTDGYATEAGPLPS